MFRDEYSALRSAIRRLPNPVLVFDHNGLLRPMNQAGSDLAATEHLHERIFSERPSHPVSRILRHTLMSSGDDDGSIVILPSGRKLHLDLSRTSEKGGTRWILLFFHDVQSGTLPPIADIAARWQLTTREGEIAHSLLEGRTSEEICTSLNISRETLKTHLSSMFGKTKSRNRPELVAKLIRSE